MGKPSGSREGGNLAGEARDIVVGEAAEAPPPHSVSAKVEAAGCGTEERDAAEHEQAARPVDGRNAVEVRADGRAADVGVRERLECGRFISRARQEDPG